MRARGDRTTGAALALAVVVVSRLLAASAHATGIARTDDWAFARVALDLHRTGHLRLVGWGQMMLVGQVAWAQPWLWAFGGGRAALELSTAALAAVGLFAVHRVARTALAPAAAALVVVSVAAVPGVVRDATTFMTDGPNLALQAMVLAVGIVALGTPPGRRRTGLDAAVLALGLWAFAVREVAVAAPVAVVIAALLSAPDRRRRAVDAVRLAGLAGASALLWRWRHGLPGGQPYNGSPGLAVALTIGASSVVTAGLGLAPALAVAAPGWWRPRHRRGRAAGAAVGAAVVAALPALAWLRGTRNWWLVGDDVQANGMNGDKLALGVRPNVLPAGLWHAVVVLAIVGTVAAAALVGEAAGAWRAGTAPRPDRTTVVLRAHLALTALVLGAAAVANGAVFDRYLWPAIASGSVLVLARGARSHPVGRLARAVRWTPLAVGAAVALLLTVESDAFDAARWRAGTAAQAGGSPAGAIDAGFEWVGAHATAAAPAVDQGHGPLVSWWSRAFAGAPVCVVVTASPVAAPAAAEIATVRWRPFVVAGRATLHVYRRTVPGCGG